MTRHCNSRTERTRLTLALKQDVKYTLTSEKREMQKTKNNKT